MGVFAAGLESLCSCRRRAATTRDVHDFPPHPTPSPNYKKKIKKKSPNTATHRAPASIPSRPCALPNAGAHGERLWLCQAADLACP